MADEIDIILITHNNLGSTITCIDSIYENTKDIPFRLTVIDDSTDLTPTWLWQFHSQHDNLNAIFPKEKITHGNQAWNIGLKNTTNEFVVLMTNSVTVEPYWLDFALDYMKGTPKVGAIGFKIIFPTGIIECAGITFTLALIPVGLGGGEAPQGRTYLKDVDAVGFCTVLCRREAVTGSLDETTYLGFKEIEDLDTCFGIKKAGWRIVYCGYGSVIHRSRLTRGTDNASAYENYKRFYKKWHKYLEAQGTKIEPMVVFENIP